MYKYILLLHVLAATIWTGGHLVLALTVLPRALKQGSPDIIQQFEAGYERLGLPALGIQVATGIWLALRYVPNVSHWISFNSPIAALLALKLLFVLLTLALALDARLRLMPRLSVQTLPALAWHVFAVTLLSVGFVVVGVGFRVGGFP
ncbi:CopD family protein [Candidatus Entotheonella palauensis]|uniref:Copper resistance protein CopD n=1 Tax=Candidatus Entotheonella gemina TaxID=1429439 RepID=W4LU26_9BACT|nr:CopD family protein [Candidatus Entotheonella palauensis]ETX01355.1 MAG: copper resistance protein CopD [Candidatus Entotheonella gemina]